MIYPALRRDIPPRSPRFFNAPGAGRAEGAEAKQRLQMSPLFVHLMVGLDQLRKADVLVAVAGAGILLRDTQPDGFLGAGVGTCQTGLAVSRDMYRSSVFYMNGRRWTYLFTDSASDTPFPDFQKMLPRIRRTFVHTLK